MPDYEFEDEIQVAYIDHAATIQAVTHIEPSLFRDSINHITFRFPNCKSVRDVLEKYNSYGDAGVSVNAKHLLVIRTALFRLMKNGRS
jgi:hypothetical protein